MVNKFLFCITIMVFIVFISVGLNSCDKRTNESAPAPLIIEHVEDWPLISPSDSNLPQISKAQLLSEVEKAIETQQAIQSWEAEYKTTFHQFPQKTSRSEIPDLIYSSQIRMITNDKKYFYEKFDESEKPDQNSATKTYIISNGEKNYLLSPNSKSIQVSSINKKVSIGHLTPADFLPSLPSESIFRQRDFPEFLDIINDPNTRLLPNFTLFDNQMCYVLELTTKLQHPSNSEELDAWKTANPQKVKEWAKASKWGLVFTIDSSAKPGEIRETEITIRLAIAPRLGFAIVHWAFGYKNNSKYARITMFPAKEVTYSDFKKIGQDLYIPFKMIYTQYTVYDQRKKQILQESQLLLKEFAFDRQYNPELFQVNFPEGYTILDSDKGINYTVGDSAETIDALTAAAKSRDEFYNNLKSKEAPELEYSKWINSKPLQLSDYKGKTIILHFWGLHCAPCMYELPRLQEQYGRVRDISSEIFISIHPFVDGDDLEELNKTIKEKGITFPVMIDAPDSENTSWGKTFKKYMIYGIPFDVKIDKTGHVYQIDNQYINTNSEWLKN
jgi:peroxiredoxin